MRVLFYQMADDDVFITLMDDNTKYFEPLETVK